MVTMCSICFVVMLVSIVYIQYRRKKNNEDFQKYFKQGSFDPENLEHNEKVMRLEESMSRMVRVMIITFTILNFSSNFSNSINWSFWNWNITIIISGFILFLVDPMPPNYDHVGWHIVIPMFTSIVWIINPFIYVFTCDYIRTGLLQYDLNNLNRYMCH